LQELLTINALALSLLMLLFQYHHSSHHLFASVVVYAKAVYRLPTDSTPSLHRKYRILKPFLEIFPARDAIILKLWQTKSIGQNRNKNQTVMDYFRTELEHSVAFYHQERDAAFLKPNMSSSS